MTIGRIGGISSISTYPKLRPLVNDQPGPDARPHPDFQPPSHQLSLSLLLTPRPHSAWFWYIRLYYSVVLVHQTLLVSKLVSNKGLPLDHVLGTKASSPSPEQTFWPRETPWLRSSWKEFVEDGQQRSPCYAPWLSPRRCGSLQSIDYAINAELLAGGQ